MSGEFRIVLMVDYMSWPFALLFTGGKLSDYNLSIQNGIDDCLSVLASGSLIYRR